MLSEISDSAPTKSSTGDAGSVLFYASPEKPSPGRLDNYLTVLAILMVALIVPIPSFSWYFGAHPQWILALHNDTVYFGRTDQQLQAGSFLVLCAKLFVIGFPAWIVSRVRSKRSSKPVAIEMESHA